LNISNEVDNGEKEKISQRFCGGKLLISWNSEGRKKTCVLVCCDFLCVRVSFVSCFCVECKTHCVSILLQPTNHEIYCIVENAFAFQELSRIHIYICLVWFVRTHSLHIKTLRKKNSNNTNNNIHPIHPLTTTK
jgi:hypothetical protein